MLAVLAVIGTLRFVSRHGHPSMSDMIRDDFEVWEIRQAILATQQEPQQQRDAELD